MVRAETIKFAQVANFDGHRRAIDRSSQFRFTVAGDGLTFADGIQSGVQTPQEPDGRRVETVDLGDVTGTVCDCGEIAPAGPAEAEGSKGGFPKFPLLALAALPGIFCCRDETPNPTPTPPTNPVPEPVSLLTFASGLGIAGAAALRRRRTKSRI